MRETDTDTKSPYDHLPTASLEMLQFRSQLLSATREFFNSQGYMEVETPILSHDTVVDAHLEPFTTDLCPDDSSAPNSQSSHELFLQTSPEFGMKRLLAAGAQAIYQITRAFRKDETGRFHNPEFTIIEWYRVGDSYQQQMDFVEQYVREILKLSCELGQPKSNDANPTIVRQSESFQRLSYDDAFERYTGTKVLHFDTRELAQLAQEKGVIVPETMQQNRDNWLNLLLVELVEPNLGFETPVFLYDYPASQAALSQIKTDSQGPDVAERFELYIHGIELCNGYQELTDPEEFRLRIDQQSMIRQQESHRLLPRKNSLLTAMEVDGIPSCSGVALGFDRLVMLVAGAISLDQVIAFPIDRA